MDVKIEGLDELVKAFSKLGEEAVQSLRQPSIDGAELVKNKAKNFINDQTGELARSLKVSKASKKPKNKYKVISQVKIGKGGRHGIPLELGHRLVYFGHRTYTHIPEHPFLRPAADESKEEVTEIMTKAMNETIDKMGGRK